MIYFTLRPFSIWPPVIIFIPFWIQEKGTENGSQGLTVCEYDIILYKCVREPKWDSVTVIQSNSMTWPG